MLLNLSNHPSAGWDDAQRAAAEAAFRAVEDEPFPNVPPAWDSDDVASLADELAARVRVRLGEGPGPHAVHVMGETTLVCALVVRLQRAGLRCLASTTEREVETLADGSRRYTFRFVRFRDYPPPPP